jgi:hypothetical protein
VLQLLASTPQPFDIDADMTVRPTTDIRWNYTTDQIALLKYLAYVVVAVEMTEPIL